MGMLDRAWPIVVSYLGSLLVTSASALAITHTLQSQNTPLAIDDKFLPHVADDTIIYYSTHPAISYFPKSDCVQRSWSGSCTEQDYAWTAYDYVADPLSTTRRSAAVVTNEHNNDFGNGPREVKIDIPAGR